MSKIEQLALDWYQNVNGVEKPSKQDYQRKFVAAWEVADLKPSEKMYQDGCQPPLPKGRGLAKEKSDAEGNWLIRGL